MSVQRQVAAAPGSAPVSRAKRADERQRQPTEIRRRLIVQAARTMIAEHGLFSTTMRDIAAAGGVSLGTLTYHFTGIDEILTEVLQAEMDFFYAPIARSAKDAPDAPSAMNLLIDGFFADDEMTLQHWRLWLDFWSLSAHNLTHAGWQRKVYQAWAGDVRAILLRGQESKDFAFDDLDICMAEFMAIFDGLAAQAYLPGSSMGPLSARDLLRGYLGRYLCRPARRSVPPKVPASQRNTRKKAENQ